MRRPAAARSVGCAASTACSAATLISTCGDWLAPLAARASVQGSVSPACTTRGTSIDKWLAPLPSRATGTARGQ
eukprot:4643853-Alexandrium_andersonii.AAC.1